MSLVRMSFEAEGATANESKPAGERVVRWARPVLGLLLPVGRARLGKSLYGSEFRVAGWCRRPRVFMKSLQSLRAPANFSAISSRHLHESPAGFGMGTLAGTCSARSPVIPGWYAASSIQAYRACARSLRLHGFLLFILWLGIFETSKVALIAVGVFFPIYLGVMGAILSVDRKIVEVGRVFRLSGAGMVRRILLPAVLPTYVVSLRSGLGLGWMFVIAAEFMGASEGLGYLLIDGQQLGKPAEIVAAILAFAVLGKATDAILAAVMAPFLRWQDVFTPAGEQ